MGINPDTCVAVCCYAGDAHQVTEMLDLYKHHECPITVLSPTDSPAPEMPGVESVYAGKRAYIGQDCLDRMYLQFAELLHYPEQHFLIHDSDSICISPELPACLYAEPDVLWSNLVINDIKEQQRGFPRGVPHLAFQPPWFLSRRTIERILEAGRPLCNEALPFIDYWLVETAYRNHIPYKSLPNTISIGLSSNNPQAAPSVHERVRRGELIFIHSVKGKEFSAPIMAARKEFLGTIS